MANKILLALKEKPSFEGELSIDLVEDHDSEGRAKYSLVCQKNPPFNAKEWALFAGVLGGVVGEDLEEIPKSICWQQELPPPEARKIMDILEHQVVSLAPENTLGLDGTTYELVIERDFNKVQFAWWCEPPRVWRALGEVSKILLTRADAASMIEVLQSDTRKQLIRQIQERLDDVQTALQKESKELIRMHNARCHGLAQSLTAAGLTCPSCGQHSKDIRFIDKSPDAKSHFICRACGRSFRPEDL